MNEKISYDKVEVWMGNDGMLTVKVFLNNETMKKFRKELSKENLPVYVDILETGET